MLIRIFTSNQNTTYGLYLLLFLLFWLPSFFTTTAIYPPTITSIKWINLLLFAFLITVQSVYLSYIVGAYNLIKKGEHLTGLCFILINSLSLFYANLPTLVFANSLVLLMLHQLLKIYNTNNNFAAVLNASFFLGIAVLVYFPSIVFFALLIVVLLYTATPTWREFVIALIGFSIPFSYQFAYHFLFNPSLLNAKTFFSTILVGKWEHTAFSHQLFLSVIALLLLASVFKLFLFIQKSVVQTRKLLMVVVVMFLLGLATIGINQQDLWATFVIVSTPAAIMLALLFRLIQKKWLSELLFFSLLFAFFMHYFS